MKIIVLGNSGRSIGHEVVAALANMTQVEVVETIKNIEIIMPKLFDVVETTNDTEVIMPKLLEINSLQHFTNEKRIKKNRSHKKWESPGNIINNL